MKCPVCDTLNPSMLCPRCGFDASRDYEKYPTFGIVGQVPTASMLRKEREEPRRAAELEKQQLLDRIAELERQLRSATATKQHFSEKQAAPAPRPLAPSSPPAPIPAKLTASQKRNVLREDSSGSPYFSNCPVFGSDLQRDQIASVTFLDTLTNAPEDAWDVSADESGSVLAWAVLNGELYDLYLAANGEIKAPESCADLFAGYSSMRQIHFGNCFNTSNVQNMFRMFYKCSSLTALDLSNLNTSKVQDMRSMFSNCSSLKALDLSNFNTSKVQDMQFMFYKCSSLKALDLSNFNTSKVQDMQFMFSDCSSLEALDLKKFNTSKVTYMCCMFSGCSSLKDLDLRKFNTSKVADMRYMFSGCSSLKTLDLRSFDTAKVLKMQFMFNNCRSLTTLKRSRRFVTDRAKTDNMYHKCPAGQGIWFFLQ